MSTKLDRRVTVLSDLELKRLREARLDGVSLEQLARRFNISPAYIRRLLLKRPKAIRLDQGKPEIRSADSAQQWIASRLCLSPDQLARAVEPHLPGAFSLAGRAEPVDETPAAHARGIGEVFEVWARLLLAGGHPERLPTPKEALLVSLSLGREAIASIDDYHVALALWTKRRRRRSAR